MHNLAAQSLELTTYVAAVHKIYVVVAELISPTQHDNRQSNYSTGSTMT